MKKLIFAIILGSLFFAVIPAHAIYDINAIINRVAGCSIPADVVITKEMLK